MLEILTSVLRQAAMITGFVSIMMLGIEYLNVWSRGEWQERFSRRKWGQYFLAAFLGATPGCLGAFAVVAMYVHRRISLGALVAAMVVTSGDESFVMLAMMPRTALWLTLALFLVGILAGALTDLLLNRPMTRALSCRDGFDIHQEEYCACFSLPQIVRQWKKCSPTRGVMTFALLGFTATVLGGRVGPPEWNWVRITLLLVSLVALFIVATVPEHFLEEHLWKHVVVGHVPRIFLWTFGVLLVLQVLLEHFQMEEVLLQNRWLVLLAAGLAGLIPESGPHLVFVTMYARGVIPLSVLIASSIVQDGHAMLPLLAHSRRGFVGVKLINFIVGMLIGAVLMALNL